MSTVVHTPGTCQVPNCNEMKHLFPQAHWKGPAPSCTSETLCNLVVATYNIQEQFLPYTFPSTLLGDCLVPTKPHLMQVPTGTVPKKPLRAHPLHLAETSSYRPQSLSFMTFSLTLSNCQMKTNLGLQKIAIFTLCPVDLPNPCHFIYPCFAWL